MAVEPSHQLPITEFAHKARVVSDQRMRAVVAAPNMATERRRATALDRTHDLQLAKAHVTAIGLTPSGPVVAEDVRNFQSGTGHSSGPRVRQAARQVSA